MMKLSAFIFFLLTIFYPINAQQISNAQLDSLYYTIIKNIKPNLTANIILPQSIDTAHIKCGFGIINGAKTNLSLFSKQKRDVLQQILDRPVLQTSFVTPKGFFRVHYDTSGSDVPTYSLTDLTTALDSAYNFEINYLGYPPPPPDNGAGGDNKYDIYITNIGGVYGYTEVDSEIGVNTWTSFMVINNSYSGFYTQGINAARVTVAHEFHHSIQAGNYIYRYDLDEFFYELTSTSMEHFVYPSIKDYIQYLPSYFRNTQGSISANGGNQEYALAIWNIFQKDKFGYDIIKKEWELMPQMRAMNAIYNVLQSYNTSFGEALNQFGVWMFYTNYRTIPGEYFEDASLYPLVKPVTTLDFSSTSFPVQLSTGPASNSFLNIVNRVEVDTLLTVITNSNTQAAIDSISSLFTFQFGLYSTPVDGSIKLSNNYYATFSAAQNSFWLTAEILNDSTLQTGQSLAGPVDFAFPAPFYYNKNAFIYIPINPDQTSDVQLNIYSISMKLVYSTEEKFVYFNGQKVVTWNGRKSDNGKLPTGVYIYVTKSGNNISKGKLVIFNE